VESISRDKHLPKTLTGKQSVRLSRVSSLLPGQELREPDGENRLDQLPSHAPCVWDGGFGGLTGIMFYDSKFLTIGLSHAHRTGLVKDFEAGCNKGNASAGTFGSNFRSGRIYFQTGGISACHRTKRVLKCVCCREKFLT
jgi:hypothetical protein